MLTGNERSAVLARRAHQSIRTGKAGETAVLLAFERLDWAGQFNDRNDIGTDLLLTARTEQGVDLEIPVGVQVKTSLSPKSSSSYFREPTKPKRGEEAGWWYRDTKRSHVDSWADHLYPHLLVLHDLESGRSYWVHVTHENIVSTGKGAKILVPEANRIDESNREALVRVAMSFYAKRGWYGSAWRGARPPEDVDRLRHALIVPRLLAPHPNLGFKEPITPDQGVALVVQGRLRNYEAFAEEHSGVPSLNEAVESDDWGWRFVAALALVVESDDPTLLLKSIDGAPDEARYTAAAIASACALLDLDRLDDATSIIKTAIDRQQGSAVDAAWLSMQYARLCLEAGRVEEAQKLAQEAKKIGTVAPKDLTAGAIAGAGANLLFNTSPWEPGALGDAISLGDTPVAWWRNQTIRRGLDGLADRGFTEWTRDTTVTFGAEDKVTVQLLSAAMLSNHAVDHNGWRRLTSLLGQAWLSELDRFADEGEVSEGLVRLIRGGDYKAIKVATKHLIADGPSAAIALAAKSLRLTDATKTTAHAELVFLEFGGTALDQDQADRAAKFLIRLLFSDRAFEAFSRRTSPTYVLEVQVLQSLAGVIKAASLRTQRAFIKRLTGLLSQRQQLLANAWRKAILAIPEKAWTEKNAKAAKPKPRAHHSSLQTTLTGVAARFDPAAKRSLVASARRGSLGAVSALGDVTLLSASAARAQMFQVCDQIAEEIEDARNGHHGMGGYDNGEILALLNIWHPKIARWNPLFDYLREQSIFPQQKYQAITCLLSLVDQIPDDVRETLGTIARDVSSQESPNDPFFFRPDIDIAGPATVLAIQLGAVDIEKDPGPYIDLLSNDFRKRVWATHVSTNRGQAEDIGTLTVLTLDPHPVVRSSAASGLASLVAKDRGGEVAVSALRRSCQDPGIWVPKSIAEALTTAEQLSEPVTQLLAELRDHPSSSVRAAAAN